MSKQCRWNSRGTGTLAIPGFQTAREDLEVPGDRLARPVPVALGGPEDLEVVVDPAALAALGDPAGLGVPAGLEAQFGMLGPSPTRRGPCRSLQTPHELYRRRPGVDCCGVAR